MMMDKLLSYFFLLLLLFIYLAEFVHSLNRCCDDDDVDDNVCVCSHNQIQNAKNLKNKNFYI